MSFGRRELGAGGRGGLEEEEKNSFCWQGTGEEAGSDDLYE